MFPQIVKVNTLGSRMMYFHKRHTIDHNMHCGIMQSGLPLLGVEGGMALSHTVPPKLSLWFLGEALHSVFLSINLVSTTMREPLVI